MSNDADISPQFNGNYPASATGGVSTSYLNPDQLASHGPSAWPPTSMGPNFVATDIANFPTLTQTGAPITLALPTPTSSASGTTGATAGATLDGWTDPSDTVGAWVSVAGCSYPPEYSATAASNLPDAPCSGNGGMKRGLEAVITPAPRQ